MKNETVAHLLGSGSYWTLNKKLHRKLGGDANLTLFLSDLVSKFLYFKKNNQLDEEDGFFNTWTNIENDIGLSRYGQGKCIKELSSLGLIETKLKGLPAKLHFYINFERIMEFLDEPVAKKTSIQLLKNHATGCLKTSEPYIKENKNKKNKNKANEDSKESKRRFTNANKYSKEKTRAANKSSKIKDKSYKRQSTRKTVRQTRKRHVGPIIEKIWNPISTVTTHRVDPNNKTYQVIASHIESLLNGTFNQGKYWDKDWIKTIPEDILTKKWSVNEIKETILEASKYSQPGYWPQTKSNSFRNLSTILYNPKSNKSMFLQAAVRPPELLSKTINENDTELSEDPMIQGMQEIILEHLESAPGSYNMKQFEKAVVSIKEHYQNEIRPLRSDCDDNDFKYDTFNEVSYTDTYGEYLKRGGHGISPDRIGAGGAVYQRFQGYLRKHYDL